MRPSGRFRVDAGRGIVHQPWRTTARDAFTFGVDEPRRDRESGDEDVLNRPEIYPTTNTGGTFPDRHAAIVRRPYAVHWRRLDDRPTTDAAVATAAGDERDEPMTAVRSRNSADPGEIGATGGGDIEVDQGSFETAGPRRVEAALLIAPGPLSLRRLAEVAGLPDATAARTAVASLNDRYLDRDAALSIETVAGGVRMMTRPHLAPWLARLSHLPVPERLSTPMMETLAVVAYRGPVSRAVVESIRGVACGELLRQLLTRDLIRIAGRGDELGRPYLYGVTKRFLQLFGLPSVAALPRVDWETLQESPAAPPEASADDSTRTESTDDTAADVSIATLAPPRPGGRMNPGNETIGSDPIVSNEADRSTDPAAAIEDEEDDLYENDPFDDEDDDDWDDPDDDDDDFDDDDADDDESDDDGEDDEDGDDDELGGDDPDWQEVGDDEDEFDDDEEEDFDDDDLDADEVDADGGDEDDDEDGDDDADWD